MTPPTCFISYSWDSTSHKDWVKELAEELQGNGVRVLLDQWDLHLGAELTNYMETSIREAGYVLLICTPTYASKANTRQGGVGYEQTIVTGELFQHIASPGKFVPILRNGSDRESLPSYLKSRVYTDFRSDANFTQSFEELLRHLHDSPIATRPALGERPSLPHGVGRGIPTATTSSPTIYCKRCGATPGEITRCTNYFGDHDFASGTGRIYCQRCGVTSGEITRCTNYLGDHNFASGTGRIYCQRCGVTPGEITRCTNYLGDHNFASR